MYNALSEEKCKNSFSLTFSGKIVGTRDRVGKWLVPTTLDWDLGTLTKMLSSENRDGTSGPKMLVPKKIGT